jgi:hypothetical protein
MSTFIRAGATVERQHAIEFEARVTVIGCSGVLVDHESDCQNAGVRSGRLARAAISCVLHHQVAQIWPHPSLIGRWSGVGSINTGPGKEICGPIDEDAQLVAEMPVRRVDDIDRQRFAMPVGQNRAKLTLADRLPDHEGRCLDNPKPGSRR